MKNEPNAGRLGRALPRGVTLVVAATLIAAFTVAAVSAQTTPPPDQFLTVGVIYVGTPPPPGTMFIVHAECGPPAGGPKTLDKNYTFTNVGPPFNTIGPNTGYSEKVKPGDLCSVTETETGGATSVSYQCGKGGDIQNPPPYLSSGRAVQFESTGPSTNITLLVINSFITPVTVPPTFSG